MVLSIARARRLSLLTAGRPDLDREYSCFFIYAVTTTSTVISRPVLVCIYLQSL
jgi:hypothetical protein